jgi:hypothetical protein
LARLRGAEAEAEAAATATLKQRTDALVRLKRCRDVYAARVVLRCRREELAGRGCGRR